MRILYLMERKNSKYIKAIIQSALSLIGIIYIPASIVLDCSSVFLTGEEVLLGSSAGELMAGKDCNSDKAEDGTAVAVAVTNGNIMWIGSSGGGV